MKIRILVTLLAFAIGLVFSAQVFAQRERSGKITQATTSVVPGYPSSKPAAPPQKSKTSSTTSAPPPSTTGGETAVEKAAKQSLADAQAKEAAALQAEENKKIEALNKARDAVSAECKKNGDPCKSYDQCQQESTCDASLSAEDVGQVADTCKNEEDEEDDVDSPKKKSAEVSTEKKSAREECVRTAIADLIKKKKDQNKSKTGSSDLGKSTQCKNRIAGLYVSAKESLKENSDSAKPNREKVREKEDALLKAEADANKQLQELNDRATKDVERARESLAELDSFAVEKLTNLQHALAKQKELIKKITSADLPRIENDYRRADAAVQQACYDEAEREAKDRRREMDRLKKMGQNKFKGTSDVLTSAQKGGAKGEDYENYKFFSAQCLSKIKTRNARADLARQKEVQVMELRTQLNMAAADAAKIATEIEQHKNKMATQKQLKEAQIRSLEQIKNSNTSRVTNETTRKTALLRKQLDALREETNKTEDEILDATAQKIAAEEALKAMGETNLKGLEKNAEKLSDDKEYLDNLSIMKNRQEDAGKLNCDTVKDKSYEQFLCQNIRLPDSCSTKKGDSKTAQ